MVLSPLQRKQRLVVLGLNSGTSADGLDLAVLRIDRSRGQYHIKQLAGGMRRYPKELRRAVLTVADASSVSPDDIIRLDQALGQFYGRTAASYLNRWKRAGLVIDLVASHGQTVRHLPRKTKYAGYPVNGTLQLGSLEQIAAHTGRIVMGDFRQADVALGHEGAPITVAAMQRLLAVANESRLIVNIGGMSNFFYFPDRNTSLEPAAADCGPGNSLCDMLASKLYRLPYDRGGRLALSGQVSQRLLTLLLAEPFFKRGVVSTGREEFGRQMADRVIVLAKTLRLAKPDLLATAAELTVSAISNSIRPFVRRDSTLQSLYLTGGGVHNRFFVRRLRERFEGISVASIAAIGYKPDLVEASAYAVMGEATLRGEALSTRFGHGKTTRRTAVMGRIAQPPQER